jgi:uncharacterized protein
MRKRNRLACAAAACAAAVLGSSMTSRGAVVINEVYGGGGNSGAPYDHDFVELYNNGATAQNLSGLVIQYAAATSAFTTNQNIIATLTSVSLDPGHYYVVAAGTGGAVGSPVPADLQGSGVNMSASAGKVRLTTNVTDTNSFVDLIGYGSTASAWEGTGPAPGGSNTTSLQRNALGLDTNNNNADFTAAGPTPGTAIPEPAGIGLVGIGALGLLRRRRAHRA